MNEDQPIEGSSQPLLEYVADLHAHEEQDDALSVAALEHMQVNELERTLGLREAYILLVGSIIGSGIFVSPGIVTKAAGSVCASFAAWFIAGVISLLGALSYAELGASIPSAGAEVTYYQVAFAKYDKQFSAFSYVWTMFFITIPAASGVICSLCADYILAVVLSPEAVKSPSFRIYFDLCVVGIVCGLTILNLTGVKWVARLQSVFVLVQFLTLVIVILLGFVAIGKHSTTGSLNSWDKCWQGTHSFQSFGMGVVAALFACLGWASLNPLAEEIQRPDRVMPQAILFSLLTVVCVYLLANLSYLNSLSYQHIINSDAIAYDLAQHLSGPQLAAFVSLCVAISSLGAANALQARGARLFYAAARDNLFPQIFARVSKSHTPFVGVLSVAVMTLACLAIIGRSPSTLIDYFGVASWIFYALAGLSLIVLRITKPDLPRPYRVHFYPWLPCFFIGTCLVLIMTLFLSNTIASLKSGAFLLLSVPVHFVYQYYLKRKTITEHRLSDIPEEEQVLFGEQQVEYKK